MFGSAVSVHYEDDDVRRERKDYPEILRVLNSFFLFDRTNDDGWKRKSEAVM